MSENDNNQEVELEEQIDEVEEDSLDLDDEVLEEEEEEETKEESEEERLKNENAKLKRILKKKGDKTPKLETKAKTPEEEAPWKQDVEFLKMAEKKRQFGYDNGLSPEETDAVFKFNSNPTKETLKDPFLRDGLKGMRRRQKIGNNTPSSSATSTFATKKFAELTDEAKDKALQDLIASKKK